MGAISPMHLLIVFLVVVVVFGSKRLPDTARALGKSMRIMKSETAAMKAENNKPADDAEPVVAPRSIEPTPGEATAARPVDEPRGQTKG
ncbi:twin-arginine translocase TatA/TatE family subunit [Streptomyces sp. 3MP-14]|uniref:Sec-independent protein translocase protein TatA n=1 Tax=Streptomyces mimosae TaxID=2586635 RepID=A0A5N6A522_9ACTN|nr:MULTISPECIES: Sec-independent protein translocase subunit TatA [Streptomyces]KAB8162498.1 twin-arginine translocase TatA/TatE family subunit [Streptomyces mimosae]KAB8174325.1 twin-arginine translocase TatA/TatE family subunit [Streptomyces sp. 3MP-14]